MLRSFNTKLSDKITTEINIDSDGTMRLVPTMITKNQSLYRAVLNSFTNSTYVLINNEVEFSDVQNHWAKQGSENMASRLVINEVGEGLYNPNEDITRDEFATILVRGLGLPSSGKNIVFSDINEKAISIE